MARRSRYTPEQLREARRLNRGGASWVKLAKQFGGTHTGLRAAVGRLPDSDAPPPPPPEPLPFVLPELPEGEGPDVVEVLERQVVALETAIATLPPEHQITLQRLLIQAAAQLAKVRKAEQSTVDQVTIPREEIPLLREKIRERITRVLERPITCQRCGRELIAELTGATLESEGT